VEYDSDSLFPRGSAIEVEGIEEPEHRYIQSGLFLCLSQNCRKGRYRYDACVVVPESFTDDKWVNVIDMPGGKHAVAEFIGTPDKIREAWGALYRSWLPGSGYQPDDRPCL
jgi:predicted transcriptional regulator YdeE